MFPLVFTTLRILYGDPPPQGFKTTAPSVIATRVAEVVIRPLSAPPVNSRVTKYILFLLYPMYTFYILTI